MRELVSGEDSGLGGWAVRICACVTGRSADWAVWDCFAA